MLKIYILSIFSARNKICNTYTNIKMSLLKKAEESAKLIRKQAHETVMYGGGEDEGYNNHLRQIIDEAIEKARKRTTEYDLSGGYGGNVSFEEKIGNTYEMISKVVPHDQLPSKTALENANRSYIAYIDNKLLATQDHDGTMHKHYFHGRPIVAANHVLKTVSKNRSISGIDRAVNMKLVEVTKNADNKTGNENEYYGWQETVDPKEIMIGGNKIVVSKKNVVIPKQGQSDVYDAYEIHQKRSAQHKKDWEMNRTLRDMNRKIGIRGVKNNTVANVMKNPDVIYALNQ